MNQNYSMIVCKLENVRPHSNAERLQLADAAGEPVVIGLDYKEGDIGLFAPAGSILSNDFLMENKLYRKNPITDEPMGGYIESNRRVRFIKLRGEMSRGIFFDMNSLDYLCLKQYPVLGTEFQELEGHAICEKYVAASNIQRQGLPGKPRSKRYEGFYEIGETPKLVLNFGRFGIKDVLVVTEKLHGTSGRTGYLKAIKRDVQKNWFASLKEKLFKLCLSILDTELVVDDEWAYVTGTRRMVLGENSPDDNNYRLVIHEKLKPYLSKGMIIYYEIVGYGIMQTHTPIGIEDKALKKDLLADYGETINYTYGVPSGFYDFYIYKIVEHNTEGVPYVYGWDQLVKWCTQRELKHVPVLDTVLFDVPKQQEVIEVLGIKDDTDPEVDAKNYMKFLIDLYCEGPSSLDTRHPKEGVVLQTKYGPFKHKSNVFCLLEDIRPYEEPELDTIEDDVE